MQQGMPQPATRSAAVVCALLLACAAVAQDRGANLFDLTIEELGDLQITSVSRRAESRSAAAASIYVITAEDIRRSGVTSIPEALRLAPGVEVARNGSSEWTISIRGFSSDLSNKLLVLIDGRSVYSPLFAGVFWDVQDTLLADIERIEVISGPGGTLWGANAVNGVINIITRGAADTPGGSLHLGSGDEEQSAAFRYGWAVNENMDARVHVKAFERGSSEELTGGAAFDEWNLARTGFALDWRPTAADDIDFRSSFYEGEENAFVRGDFTLGTLPQEDIPDEIDLSGSDLLVSWRRTRSPDSFWRMLLYYDHTDRQIPGSFNEARDTFDFELQHDLAAIGRHNMLWGAGLRSTSDDIGNTLFATFTPASRSDRTLSAFLQDRIEIRPEKVFLTIGSKFEDNDYTGFEYQPNVRVTWLASDVQTVWGALSRAVRVPARLNTDLRLIAPLSIPGLPFPVFVNVNGNRDYESEELSSLEAGYRIRIRDSLSVDVAVFTNEYDKLQTQEAVPPIVVPGPPTYLLIRATLDNGLGADSSGGTIAVNWQPLQRLRLQMHYARLNLDLDLDAGSNDLNAVNVAGNSPENQIGAHAFVELPHHLSLYAGARYVDELPNQGVPSYTALDLSLAWNPTPRLRVSATMNNANDARHLEFGSGRYIERRAFLQASWTF
jgi:iron complex outermembrane receptor protein